jgi:predicted phosphoadenosine phosphosulfate sulfurtransferase
MALKTRYGTMSVVDAAKTRIKNAFDSGIQVVLSTSGGKDSICLMKLVYDFINSGQYKPEQLLIQFVDEEAMFDDVIKIVMDWRLKFQLLGVKFEWYCVPVVHYNCLNSLEDGEHWILWNPEYKNKWVRPMPKFAITDHPLLRAGKDNYQTFLRKVNKGKIVLVGIRIDEGVQRKDNIARVTATQLSKNSGGLTSDGFLFPIYDWRDTDIWQFIRQHNLDFPVTYLNLYQVGTRKNNMRISQMFSVDTAGSLVKLQEYVPDLMERITIREPNAYLAALYWESEMFRRAKKPKKMKNLKTGKRYVWHCLKNS